jgi:radical SAM superfamily enzyme YgiQ (UPF0313 family)
MNRIEDKKLLLSSVCQPFGEKYGDGFGVSYEGSHQIMWAQGIFRTRATTTQWGIDFIAENLKTPTTTLHYPSMSQFISEIKKGYDYVGIAFVASTMHKMIPMVEAIRTHAPETKVVLGGYGTALGDIIKPYADYICTSEGVAFMRKLLNEPLDQPLVQPTITQKQSLFSIPIPGRVGYIFAGLGCPNGCDFCATSHFFKKKHIKLLPDGQAIINSIHRLRDIYPKMNDFWLCDEDLLLNQSRGREFLQAVRQSNLPPLAISAFGSVKALSQYKASELVEMGIDWIWVGFEGMRAGYSKMEGRSYRDLFADLKNHGISILASMIIGFDYQTEEIIQEEFEELIQLEPTASQFLIYGTPYGTPSFERMQNENRLVKERYCDHSRHDGFTLTFKHPHIGPEQMSAIQRRLYREEFERLGPSIYRVVDNWLTGYEKQFDHPAARVRAKASKYREDAHRMMMTIPAAKKYLDSTMAEKLDNLSKRLMEITGPMTVREKISSKLLPAMLAYTDFKVRNNIGQQPKFSRREYRMSIPKTSEILIKAVRTAQSSGIEATSSKTANSSSA